MRRPKGGRLNPMYCKATHKHGGGGIMVLTQKLVSTLNKIKIENRSNICTQNS